MSKVMSKQQSEQEHILPEEFNIELSKIVERMYFDIRKGSSDLRPFERQIKGLTKKTLEAQLAEHERQFLMGLKEDTRKWYARSAFISIESQNSEMYVHTNALIEYKLAHLSTTLTREDKE